jgi:hypothetical protein
MGPSSRTSSFRWFALVAVALTVVLAAAGAATAHGDEGKMQLEATASGPLQAFVRATVIYENDSEVALGATVTVEASGPDGQSLPPTPLVEAGDGRYEATLTFPVAGAWTLRATAADPAATGEVAFTATETAVPVTTTTVPEVDVGEPRRATAPADDDEGSSLVVPIIVVVAIGLGAAIGAWVFQRRRRAT